jgi:polysaccharide export outer membrane protein
MRLLVPLAVLIIFLGSCVSNKKVQLLQKGDVNAKNLPNDTVLRTYALDTFNYKVQANDILSVRFESLSPKEMDFLSNRTGQTGQMQMMQGSQLLIGELVDERGNIPFPVVGKVNVAGLTVFQIQDKLQILANQYIESPLVKVRLINYRVTILGEVKIEGTTTLFNNRVTFLEAIGHAGGFNELADRAHVKLIRQIGGKIEVQYINLLDENFMLSPNFYVYQNDVLIIPPLRQRPFRNYFAQNFSIFVSALSVVLLAANLLQN